MREFLRFEPLYQERVWGGRSLETVLGRTLPGGPIGESWEIVDRPEAQSVIREGRHAGMKFREVLRRESAGLLGPGWPAEKPFPILVKWLDCRERLSLQVHPPADVAAALGGEPKTETWYLAATEPGAHLFAGLRRGVTRAQFEKAVAAGNPEDCIHRFPVATGDSILIESGRVHAIDAGVLVLEIQQNSDTTYRVFDWGRVGLDGKPRRTHLSEALRSILWDDFEPAPVRGAPTSGVLSDCAAFRLRRLIIGRGETISFQGGEQPRLFSVVAGSVRVSAAPIGRGETILLPFGGDFEIQGVESAIALVTENFVSPGLVG